MGTSLAFHIVFAVLGVGLPLLMCLAEGLALRRHDAVWLRLARRWSGAFGVLFAVGAVSGTILSFELGLLWPVFMKYAGPVVGLPFSAEGFAFFLEAIFVGLYLYGWDRLSPRAHWLCSLPIVVSGAASAWFVVTANAWMNAPAGFRISHGKVVDVDPLAAMFNAATPVETAHFLVSAYTATAFGVAAVYAVGLLRGRRDAYHRKALALALALATIGAPLMPVTGDLSARFVADHQPAKLAAMEALYHTERGAALRIGGLPDPASGTVRFAITIPHGLSLLVAFTPNATVRGLDSFPADQRPDAQVVHTAFDLMVGIGFALLGVVAWYWLWRLRARRKGETWPGRWLLRALALAGPATFLAIEAGWTVTEVGRQPWVIYGIVRTAAAITTQANLGLTFMVFNGIYVVLAVTTTWLLLRLARQDHAPDTQVELPDEHSAAAA
jgi:cytochrome d ubiquinol oxidase subunit I